MGWLGKVQFTKTLEARRTTETTNDIFEATPFPNTANSSTSGRITNYTPPPPKILQADFLSVELILLGLPEKSATWLPEIFSGELISMGLPKSLARSQHSVKRCKLVTSNDYRKYW